MKKGLILIGLLALTLPSARAQYFDWVMTYQSTHGSGISPDSDNMVLDMATDSRGNIYFIGRCVRGAAINGEELLAAVNHYEPSHNHYCLCIVKMSPSGEMLWHKAISDWNSSPGSGEIQVVGDSSVVCYVPFGAPFGINSPAYWLDSLVQYPNWFVPLDSISYSGNALVTFDLDGNLKEQHFLNVGVMDTLGAPVIESGNRVACIGLGGTMHIDPDGNIVIGANCSNEKWYRDVPCDTCEHPWRTVTYSVENGGVGAVRIMVDGTRSLFYYPENRPIMTNAKLLKFSPHFDSLLEVRYLMQSRLDSPRTGYGVPGITDTRIKHIDSDPEGNLYVVGYIDTYNTDSIVPIDSARGLTLHLKNQNTGFIIKYDPQLRPIYVKQIEEAYITHFVHDLVVGDNLFVLGGGCTLNRQDAMYYDDEPLNDFHEGVVFLRLHKDDGRLISYGKATPGADSETWHAVDNRLDSKIAVRNNRVATQVRFLGGINFANRTVRVPEPPYWGNGAVMWDYDGHELNLWNYNVPSPDCEATGALFTDSSLYFSGMFIGQATFGDTSFNVSHSNAYLARYVDTAFLHPYVHPTPPGPSAVPPIPPTTLTFTLSPNPTTGMVTVVLPPLGEGAVLTVADATGREVRRQSIAPAAEGTRLRLDLKGLPAGAYFVTVVTPQGSHTEKLVVE